VSRLPNVGHDDDEVVNVEVLDFMALALREPLPADIDILVVTIPAPFEALEKFLRLVPKHMAYLFRSPAGTQIAGGGCVHALEAIGERRFEELRDQAAQLWPRVLVRQMPGCPSTAVVVGGAGFAPHVPSYEPWTEFASDAFSLARWGYVRRGKSAFMSLGVTRADLEREDAVDQFIGEARRILLALEYESPTSLIETVLISPAAVHHITAGEWDTYIAAIKEALASGTFDKIVAARRCVVDLPRRLEATGFMARVFAAYPDTTHFALLRENTTFLGATPETLFRKEGATLITHALAGTTRVKDDPTEDSSRDVAALSRSGKDLGEHALVVKEICNTLWPLSKKIKFSSTPHARKVRNLIHLQTPISAELREGVDVLDLVSVLHPTPAVGGFPSKPAAQWLRQNEPLERGMYTGVVGWFDADGNGEFSVAIRCGVLAPNKAFIYAGAGIVPASDAGSEYLETRAKMHPLLRALGVML
jgi:isochorismate synthase